MEEQKLVKPVNKFYCSCCDYKCNRKYDYDLHLATQKHKKAEMIANGVEIVKKPTKELFHCGCGKQYKQKFSLARHKQTCDYKEPVCVSVDIVAQQKELIDTLDKMNSLWGNIIDVKDTRIETLKESIGVIEKILIDRAELLMAADIKNKLLQDEMNDEIKDIKKTHTTLHNNLFEKYIELQETNKSLEDMLSKAHN